jgi:hypothetical protein
MSRSRTAFTARRGSSILYQSTALTSTGTPSRVTVSWVARVTVTTRMSSRTIRSRNGISQTTPGPLTPFSRPSR